MAIGSTPLTSETSFVRRWGELSAQEKEEWFAHIRSEWHPNLLAGEATIHYPDPERIAAINADHARWANTPATTTEDNVIYYHDWHERA